RARRSAAIARAARSRTERQASSTRGTRGSS
ncbi:crossover junction endodeoxyribonuclease RuvC, partial [Propionibacterium freudenreichii]|nr:crossover junction endodeoxyribonuclease RuvC [Propionibacterium freudenreichii]